MIWLKDRAYFKRRDIEVASDNQQAYGVMEQRGILAKYGIVSYRMETRDRERKNLSYEQLSDTPSLSVVGIYAKYEPFSSRDGYTRFFVLVEKGDEKQVMESLKAQKDVVYKSDDLHGYDEFLQQRIIVSLAINALGKKGKGGMMYNNGMLLVCDDQNFGVSKKIRNWFA